MAIQDRGVLTVARSRFRVSVVVRRDGGEVGIETVEDLMTAVAKVHHVILEDADSVANRLGVSKDFVHRCCSPASARRFLESFIRNVEVLR